MSKNKDIIQDIKHSLEDGPKKNILEIIQSLKSPEMDEKMRIALTTGSWGIRKNKPSDRQLQMLQRLSHLRWIAKDDKQKISVDDEYLPKKDNKYIPDENNKYDQVD